MGYFLDSLSSALALIAGLDAEVYFVVWTSIMVSVSAVVLAAAVGVPAGVLTALNRFRGRALLLQALDTLMAIPTVVVGLFLYGLLGRQGPLGELGMLYTPAAIVLGEAVLITPIVWNLSVSAVQSTDPRLAETARSLGAGTLQQYLLIVVEARQALVAAVVTGFGRAIGEVGVAMMLGGNIAGYTRTMTTAIALETSKGEFELALALGLLLLAVAFAVTALLQRLKRA